MKTGRLYSIGVLLALCLMGFLLAMPGFSGNAQVIETKQSAVAPTTEAKVKLSIPDTPRENLRYLDAALKMYKPVTNYFDGSATSPELETIYAPLCFLPSEQTGISYPDTWTMGGYMSVKFDYRKLELIGLRCNGNDNQGGYNPAPWDPNLGPLEPNDGTADFSPYHISAYYFSGAPVIDNPTGHARFFVYAWDIFWMDWPITNYQEVFSRPMGYLIFSRISQAFADGTAPITVDTNETYSSYYSWPRVPGTLDVWDTSWNVFKVNIQEPVGEIGIANANKIFFVNTEDEKIDTRIVFSPKPAVSISSITKQGQQVTVSGRIVDVLSNGGSHQPRLTFNLNGYVIQPASQSLTLIGAESAYSYTATFTLVDASTAPAKTNGDTTPPRQSGGTPGQSGNTPGQSGNTPGQNGSLPPGQSGDTPGQSGNNPGNSVTTMDLEVSAANCINNISSAWSTVQIQGNNVTETESGADFGDTSIFEAYKFRVKAIDIARKDLSTIVVYADPNNPQPSYYNKVYSPQYPAGTFELTLYAVPNAPGEFESDELVAVDFGNSSYWGSTSMTIINADVINEVKVGATRPEGGLPEGKEAKVDIVNNAKLNPDFANAGTAEAPNTVNRQTVGFEYLNNQLISISITDATNKEATGITAAIADKSHLNITVTTASPGKYNVNIQVLSPEGVKFQTTIDFYVVKVEIDINKTPAEDDDITLLNPAQTIEIKVTLHGKEGELDIAVTPAASAALDKGKLKLAIGGSGTVTLTPKARSQQINDIFLTAKMQNELLATEDMTIVEVVIPKNIRAATTPAAPFPDRIPPRVDTPINVQVLPDLGNSGQVVVLETEGANNNNGTLTINGNPTFNITKTDNVNLRGATQTEPGNGGNLRFAAKVRDSVLLKSAGFSVSAIPVNFKNEFLDNQGECGMRVHVTWESDSGWLDDLDQCKVREYVTYPKPIPAPFQAFVPNNPTIRLSPFAVFGSDNDTHNFNLKDIAAVPVAGSFVSDQWYQIKDERCGSEWTNSTNYNITRTVGGEPRSYTVTKTGPGLPKEGASRTVEIPK